MGQVFVTGRFAAVWALVHEAAIRDWAELDVEEGAFGVVGQFEDKAWAHFESIIDSAYRAEAQEIADKRTSWLKRIDFTEMEQDFTRGGNLRMNLSDKLCFFDDVSIFIFSFDHLCI